MKRIIVLFSILLLLVPFAAVAQECNIENWTMNMLDMWYASSVWRICPDRIEFEITPTTSSFSLCFANSLISQNGRSVKFSPYFSDEEYARISFDNLAFYDGCEGINQGVTVTGQIYEFPSWFDIFSPFTFYHLPDHADFDGAPIPPTTSSSSSTSSSSTTTSRPSTTTTSRPSSTTTSRLSTTTTSSSSGACLSETIYAGDSKVTELLRHFRDNLLSKTPEGRELIKLYYQWSPAIIKAMEENEEFQAWVREMIDSVLPIIERETEQYPKPTLYGCKSCDPAPLANCKAGGLFHYVIAICLGI